MLQGRLSLRAPDVRLGSRLIVSADDAMDGDPAGRSAYEAKPLRAVGIDSGAELLCEDAFVDSELRLTVQHDAQLPRDDIAFRLDGTAPLPPPANGRRRERDSSDEEGGGVPPKVARVARDTG